MPPSARGRAGGITGGLGWLDGDDLIEGGAVVTDGHGERHQLPQGFIRRGEPDEDRSGPEFHPFREALKVQKLDSAPLGIGHFNQNRRLLDPLLPGPRNLVPKPVLSPLLVVDRLAAADTLEMGRQILPAGQTAGPYETRGYRGQELLGPPPTHAQERFQQRAVCPLIGELLEAGDCLRKTVEPERFVGHRADFEHTRMHGDCARLRKIRVASG